MFKLGFSKDSTALISIIFFILIVIIDKHKDQAYAIAIDQSTVLDQSLLIENQRKNNTNNINIDSVVASKTTTTTTTTTTTAKPQSISFDPRRPIWNLAHMVNSIKELDYRLR